MKQFSVEWNTDYGVLNREGWTVVIDGITAVSLEPSLLTAIQKAIAWLKDPEPGYEHVWDRESPTYIELLQIMGTFLELARALGVKGTVEVETLL